MMWRLAWLAAVAGLSFIPSTMLRAQHRFAAADLRQDLALLRSSILEAHAGLYEYRTQREIVHLFDSVEVGLHDTTEAGFFNAVAGLLAGLRDGHTKSLPSERWMAWYADSADVIPVRMRFVGGHALVTASADSRIAPGAEILAINRRPIKQVTAELGRRLPIDGHVPTGAMGPLNTQFELWYHLFIDQTPSFELQIRRPGGDTVTVRALAVKPGALPTDPSEQQSPLELRFLPDSDVAVLRIATFSADEIAAAGLDYAAFLDAAFARLAQTRASNLIVDLRGNDGGRDSYGALLLRHLIGRPFEYYRSLEARSDRISFWSHTNLDSTFNARFGAGMVRTPAGTYRLPVTRHQNLGLQQPQPPIFTGHVWVLIDGGTFSTAAEFCAVAQSLGRATFVGEETGGTYEGNTSGTFAILTLTHTGIRVVIPLVRYTLAVTTRQERGRGVIPDHRPQEPLTLDDAPLLAWIATLARRGN